MTISIQAAVEHLIDARSSRRLLAPLSETHGDLTLEHAYAIQDALRTELDRRGERPIGWKLGATSPSGQAVMGISCAASRRSDSPSRPRSRRRRSRRRWPAGTSSTARRPGAARPPRTSCPSCTG